MFLEAKRNFVSRAEGDKLYINEPITDKEALSVMNLPWQTNLDLNNKKIINVETCTSPQDGANKKCV